MKCPKCGSTELSILRDEPAIDLLEGTKFWLRTYRCLKCGGEFKYEIMEVYSNAR